MFRLVFVLVFLTSCSYIETRDFWKYNDGWEEGLCVGYLSALHDVAEIKGQEFYEKEIVPPVRDNYARWAGCESILERF